MGKLRNHFVAYLEVKLPILKNDMLKKHTDANKKEQDRLEREMKNQEKFDTLMQDFPKVAQAVFYRELQDRLLAVIYAEKDKAEQEFKRVSRGQQLTRLENQVYAMKSELLQRELPHLESRQTGFWVARKRRTRDKSDKKNTADQSRGRKRSNSKKRQDASSKTNAARSSSGSKTAPQNTPRRGRSGSQKGSSRKPSRSASRHSSVRSASRTTSRSISRSSEGLKGSAASRISKGSRASRHSSRR